jgi:hypothetical protein
MGERQNTNLPGQNTARARTGTNPLVNSLTVFDKDAIVFEIQSYTGNRISMISSAQVSLSSWNPVFRFRAELFRVVILLVLFIITGVAVTPITSG